MRTISEPSGHRVRLAFPRGRRQRGSGQLVSILHPLGENPCTRNPLQILSKKYRGKTGFSIVGTDPNGRYVRMFTISRESAQRIKEKIGQGQEINVPDFQNPNFQEKVRDVGGREWFFNVFSSPQGFTAEGYPVSGKRLKRVGKPLVVHAPTEAEAQDRLIAKIENPAKDNPPNQGTSAAGAKDLSPKTFYVDWHGRNEPAEEYRTRAEAVKRAKELRFLGNTVWVWEAGKKGSIRTFKPNPNGAAGAKDLYETFHGEPSQETLEIYQKLEEPKDYASLGDLLAIKIVGYGGEIGFDTTNGNRVILASTANGKQLYFIGGNQDLSGLLGNFNVDSSKNLIDLGPVAAIAYRTRKDFDGFAESDYVHQMGEHGHQRPRLLFDKVNSRMQLVGGDYKVKREGIIH